MCFDDAECNDMSFCPINGCYCNDLNECVFIDANENHMHDRYENAANQGKIAGNIPIVTPPQVRAMVFAIALLDINAQLNVHPIRNASIMMGMIITMFAEVTVAVRQMNS